MPGSVPQISSVDGDALEAEVDEWIALCGGDMQETIRVLVVAHNMLHSEVATALPAVSYGYSKGWHARRRG